MRPPAPKRPGAGSHNERFLDALLAAYPHAYWKPSGRLHITAHSRASELRLLGWDVQSVHRTTPGGRLEYGYVLRMPDATVADARREALTRTGKVSLDDEVIAAALVSPEVGLTMSQLRYLDRVGKVPFDVVAGNSGRYLRETVHLLQALGMLVKLGLGLDTALHLLRHHAADVATALRLARADVEEGVA